MLLAHVLDPLRRSISGPHANRGEASFEPALGPVPQTHILPLSVGQHVFGRRRQYIGNVPLAGTTSTGERPDQFNLHRINLLVTRDTNGPGQAACREPLTERRAEAVTGIREHTAKAHTGCHHAIDLRQGDHGLGPRCAVLAGTPARFKRAGLLVQLSGRKRRNATMTGTSPRESVSDTYVWQLAVLPS